MPARDSPGAATLQRAFVSGNWRVKHGRPASCVWPTKRVIIDPSPSSLFVARQQPCLFFSPPLFFSYSFRDPFTGRWSRNRDCRWRKRGRSEALPCLPIRLSLWPAAPGQGGQLQCLHMSGTREHPDAKLSCAQDLIARNMCVHLLVGRELPSEDRRRVPSARATVLSSATPARPRRSGQAVTLQYIQLPLERAQGTVPVPVHHWVPRLLHASCFPKEPCFAFRRTSTIPTYLGSPPRSTQDGQGGRRLGRRLCDQAADCQLDSKGRPGGTAGWPVMCTT